ncbi:MAG: hypothetical protein N2578_03165 [Bdellovibrionaceae bacterium]|nr:hypothetical protein [Pseudobdellovibrionaceae bacterium]
MFKAILDFLFGKDPDIFNEKGQVVHKLPKKKWDAWHNRTKVDPAYNWRNHSGFTGSRRKD